MNEVPLSGQFAVAYSALRTDKATAQTPNKRIVAQEAYADGILEKEEYGRLDGFA